MVSAFANAAAQLKSRPITAANNHCCCRSDSDSVETLARGGAETACWRCRPCLAPCRGCPEKEIDLGGCRCQAFRLTGDASNADPVCSKSAHHGLILAAREEAERAPGALQDLQSRNEQASRLICKA